MPTRFCESCQITPIRRDNATGRCRKCYTPTKKAAVPTDTLAVQGDKGTLTKVTSERVKTLADLIRVCEIDTTEWLITNWTANKWEMGAKDADGNLTSQDLYQIKASLRRNVGAKAIKAELASLVDDTKAGLSGWARTDTPGGQRSQSGRNVLGVLPGVLLEIAIPDLHLGKLAWAPETGYSDYDLKIAEKLFDTALETLIERTSHFPIQQIVFPVGNDLLHSDTKQGTTTKGTPLDTDSRYYKAFGIGRRMISRAIDRLRRIAPVRVVCVAGNHDVLSTYHLSDSLQCLYGDVEGVTIDASPMLRKYFQFGQVALCFTHGDRGKSNDWPLLFATEQPQMFGSSKFREIHVGHIHQTRTTEHHGVRVRVSPSLSAPDAYHSENQYVGHLRSAEAFVWDQEEGLIAQAFYTVPEGK